MNWIRNIFIVLLTITPLLSTPLDSYTPDPINEVEVRYSEMEWVTEWLASTEMRANYGMGKFYYRLAKSKYPVDKIGNYRYEVYFISDSFYQSYTYQDVNGDGVADIYRSATRIEHVNLFVDGVPFINQLTGTQTFWLLFTGNFEAGVGDLGIVFRHPSPNAQVFIKWSQPKPF